MTRYITLYPSNALKPKDIYLRGIGITHSRTITEILGGLDTATRTCVRGLVVVQPQVGQWVRRPPLPPQGVLAGLKIWLERKND